MRKQKKARVVLSTVLFSLMFNATIDTRPAVGATLKAKLKTLITKAESGIKSSLAKAYQKVKTLDKSIIIDRLSTNITKLGTQVGDIKDCMLFGLNCSAEKRAAFYATAITVLALTAAVVGFTVTVAATAQEPEETLSSTLDKTSHDVSGRSPAAVFERLSNSIGSFKDHLASLKTCLVNKRCSKPQKRMLYASAATVTALVTIAIGLGVGSYLYAQKQEEKRKMEELEQQMREEREEKERQRKLDEQQKIKEAQEEAAKAKTEEERAAAEKKLDALLKAAEMELQELTSDPTKEEPEAPETPFQRAFSSIVRVAKESTHDVVQTSKQITHELKEKAAKALAAVAETAKEKKLKLYQEAKDAFEKAKKSAQKFIARVKESDFIEMIHNIFHINIAKLMNAIKPISPTSATIVKHIANLNTEPIWDQINGLTETIYKAQDTGLELWNKITTVGTELTKRKAWTTLQWGLRKPQEEIDRIARESYPLATKFDELWNTYPKLLAQLNSLSLEQPGHHLARTLNASATLIGSIVQLQEAAAPIGTIFVPSTIIPPLTALQEQLKTLAQNITRVATIKPLINTAHAPSTFWALYEVMKTYSQPQQATGLQTVLMAQISEIQTQSTAMTSEITKLQTVSDELSKTTLGITTLIKRDYIKKLEKNPIKVAAHAPKTLLQTIAKQIEPVKEKLDAVLESSGKTLEYLNTIILHTFPLLHAINGFIGSTEQSPFVGREVFDAIGNIAKDLAGIMETVNALRAGLKQTPEAP